MADVGLLGFPNVGKSTFVAAVSAARPKIADYPFTTLTPSLGVVEVGGGIRAGGSSFVIADIPGLIPGASEGVGLGIRFLQHVERTRVLLHLVTLDPGEGRDPVADYRALRHELRTYSPALADRPEVVALSKADVTEVKEAYPALARRFARSGIALRLVSAVTREGLADLVRDLHRLTRGEAVTMGVESPAGPSVKKTKPAKKVAAKKTPARKTPAKKTPPKKVAAKKTAAKKAPAKKTATKKAPAKKTRPAKKTAAKKGAVRRG
jgi:GTP-binding protein